MTTPSQNDAAPCGNGACVNDSSNAPNVTPVSLTPPAHHNAPAGTSELPAKQITTRSRTLRERVLASIATQHTPGATGDARGRRAAAWGAVVHTSMLRKAEGVRNEQPS
jgi:hypothetical protein